ncbi:hypothetical protein [Marmoricola sp. URHB0036]|jgi:hypothetical protein|uniref:hypothetical protein n=1 Tax=Marmoricola sp. URHB0036 TaxID=1298863 RepID=UPI0004049A4B|nr:hypothetical protein [Marmoricola sp. URHB0036]
MNQLVGPLFAPLQRWAENSQRQACRNAMVASTALAAGRRERDETQEFVDSVLARRARRAGAAPPSLPAARLG